MSEVMHEAQQEFWRPPSLAAREPMASAITAPAMAEICPRCSTEFLLGSHFCHTCGASRPLAAGAVEHSEAAQISSFLDSTVSDVRWLASRTARMLSAIEFPTWLRYLHFHEIKRWIGLPTASLIAFVIGMACTAGAILVGLLTAKTLVDWQAIQFYRAEWLLAATAAFVAGILLKRPSDKN
jgi:hypothetical protein